MTWRDSIALSLSVAAFLACAEGTPPATATSIAQPAPAVAPSEEPPEPPPEPSPPAAPPARATCLMESYPDAIAELTEREGAWVVSFADGREAPWDDGREKDHETRLDEPDLEDTLAQRYPAGDEPGPPAEDFEPGRVRHEALLENAYGANERAVREHLVSLRWPGREQVRVSSRNGAADALREVIAGLAGLTGASRRCAEPPIGSFFHRNIRGTERLSAHAFGIAVDLNPACGEYWRWQRPFEGRWRSRMPRPVVDLFEAHEFAWGGRWYHYDTFHFEYRPELFRCR